MDLIRHLQEVAAPNIFTPPAVYDGRKNMFAIRELPFTEGSMTVRRFIILSFSFIHTAPQFDVSLPQPAPTSGATARPPKVYKIKLTKVATINPEYVYHMRVKHAMWTYHVSGLQPGFWKENKVTTMKFLLLLL
jgi:eukaryotic translation initiation factor 2C